MLGRISIGWRALNHTLNELIDTVNRQKPLPSASIAVEESPNGSLLKVTKQSGQAAAADSPWATDPNGNPAGWCQLAVIDNSTGVCVTKHLWYWGTAAR